MIVTEQILTIIIVIIATQLTRWIPFLMFRSAARTHAYVHYIGRMLPPSIFGMLVVYCFKDTDFSTPQEFMPQIVCSILVALLQLRFQNICLSMVLGTATYMLWVNSL